MSTCSSWIRRSRRSLLLLCWHCKLSRNVDKMSSWFNRSTSKHKTWTQQIRTLEITCSCIQTHIKNQTQYIQYYILQIEARLKENDIFMRCLKSTKKQMSILFWFCTSVVLFNDNENYKKQLFFKSIIRINSHITKKESNDWKLLRMMQLFYCSPGWHAHSYFSDPDRKYVSHTGSSRVTKDLVSFLLRWC